MSTRCHVWFIDGGHRSGVYVHCDGYPETDAGMLNGLQDFFDEVERQSPRDTRFHDCDYLAARYIVYKAVVEGEWCRQRWYANNPPIGPENCLGFIGIGVCNQEHGDLEFVYTVNCDEMDEDGRPKVTYKAVRA